MFQTLALKPKILIIGAVCIAIATTFAIGGVYIATLQSKVERCAKDLQAEKLKLEEFKIDVAANSLIAAANQKMATVAKEREYEQKATQSDQRFDALRRDYNARLVRLKEASGRSSTAISGAESIGATVSENASGSSGICISEQDAFRVSELSAYAQAAHEWAITLDDSDN